MNKIFNYKNKKNKKVFFIILLLSLFAGSFSLKANNTEKYQALSTWDKVSLKFYCSFNECAEEELSVQAKEVLKEEKQEPQKEVIVKEFTTKELTTREIVRQPIINKITEKVYIDNSKTMDRTVTIDKTKTIDNSRTEIIEKHIQPIINNTYPKEIIKKTTIIHEEVDLPENLEGDIIYLKKRVKNLKRLIGQVVQYTEDDDLSNNVLNDLSNVEATPLDGQVLKWDNASQKWVADSASSLETLTKLELNIDGKNLEYTPGSGVKEIIDLSAIIDNFETVTSVAITGDNLVYTDEAGVVTNIDLKTFVKNNETVSTFVYNGNGSFTYKNESGIDTVVDIKANETTTTLAVAGSVLTYTDEDGVATNIDIKNLETLTLLTQNADGTLTYLDENGVSTTVSAKTFVEGAGDVAVIGAGTQADPYKVSFTEAHTQVINTQADGKEIATFTNENGDNFIIKESVTELALNNNSLDFKNENGVITNIDLSSYLDNKDNQQISLTSNELKLANGTGADTTVDLASYLDNTDNQDLTLAGNTLSLTNDGTTVDLSSYLDNTDSQTLSIAGNTITIANGNSITIPVENTTNELNTNFTLNGNSLDITDAAGTKSVDLASYLDNTDSQAISLAGNTISITGNGATVDLSQYLDNTDEQNLTLTGTTLAISNGNSVDLSALDHTGTTGSVFFAGANNKPTEDNSQFFWDDANNRLGIGTSSPTHKLQVKGQVRATSMANANGTANAPAYRFHADANTGMFRPGADQLGFSTGGTEALRIDTNGNIGIGDDTPDATLDVAGSFRLDGTFADKDGDVGTAGQLLSTTSTGTDWVNADSVGTDNQNLTAATLTGNSLKIEIEDGTPVTVDLTNLVNDADFDITNEIQDLSLVGNNLKITNNAGSTTIDLSPYLDNTDEQKIDTFELVANTLSISAENDGEAPKTVSLAAYLDNTDNQQISLTNNELKLANGTGADTTVDLASYLDNTDNQDLTLAGNTLSLTNDGTTVDLSSYLDNTDSQTLSIAGNTITIANGNSITIPVENTTNELNTNFTLNGNSLDLTDAAGTKSVDLASYLDNTDNQLLAFDSLTKKLEISAGNNVDLASLMDNTDNQDLQLVGNSLVLSNDLTSVDMSQFLDNTDSQQLSFNNNTITLSNGGSIDLSQYVDTDNQEISLNGNILKLNNGKVADTTIDLSAYLDDTDTDDQTLSLSGNTLTIADGNNVDLASLKVEPWFGVDDNNVATDNTENIYTMGRVGIGTDNPLKQLDVRGTARVEVNGSKSYIDLVRDGSTRAKITSEGGFMIDLTPQGNGGSGYLKLSGDSSSDRFVVRNSSNNNFFSLTGNERVGVGTIDPERKLDVRGIIRAGKDSSTTGTTILEGRYSGDNVVNTFGSYRGSGSTVIGYAVRPDSATPGYLSSANNVQFQRSALEVGNGLRYKATTGATNTPIDDTIALTEVFTIRPNGNVGLGNTNPLDKLHIVGDMRLDGALKDKDGDIGTNGQILTSTVNGTDWKDAPAAVSCLIGGAKVNANGSVANSYGNISGISKTGTGKYTVNFTNNLVINNYYAHVSKEESSGVRDDVNIDIANYGASNMSIIIHEGDNGGTANTYINRSFSVTLFDANCTTLSAAANSDERLKKDILPLENSLEKILGLNGVSYYWNKEKYPFRNFDDKREVGLIAQEVEEIVPEIVDKASDGYMTVDYGKLAGLFVESFKEVWIRVLENEERINYLEEENNLLKKELCQRDGSYSWCRDTVDSARNDNDHEDDNPISQKENDEGESKEGLAEEEKKSEGNNSQIKNTEEGANNNTEEDTEEDSEGDAEENTDKEVKETDSESDNTEGVKEGEDVEDEAEFVSKESLKEADKEDQLVEIENNNKEEESGDIVISNNNNNNNNNIVIVDKTKDEDLNMVVENNNSEELVEDDQEENNQEGSSEDLEETTGQSEGIGGSEEGGNANIINN